MNAPVKIRPDTVTEAPIDPLALLRQPFPAHQISKLPKPLAKRDDMDKLPKANCTVCGGYHATSKILHLDYVGHAALTDRLLDADPHWTWEPVADPAKLGLPTVPGGLWITLTVAGVTRYGFGDPDGKTGGNAVKETIGDALRNAAMRFGAALDLWHKGDLHTDEEPEAPAPRQAAPNTTRGAESPDPPSLGKRADRLETALRQQTTLDGLRKAYTLASALCAQLSTEMPKRLTELETLYQTLFERLDEPPPSDPSAIADDEIPY